MLRQPVVFQVVPASSSRSTFQADLAATGARSFLPSSIALPQSRQTISILLTVFEAHKLGAEPIDRFLGVPPVAHPLAIVQAPFPDMFGRSPLLAAIRFGLEGSACVSV
jgi:hypothetical protein